MVRRFLFVLMTLWAMGSLLPVRCLADGSGNFELIGYIESHKKTGPWGFARFGASNLAEAAHKEVMDRARDVQEASDSLGMYYKAFGFVDLIYQSLRFGFNVKNTYEIASERISQINTLLEEYIRDMALRGDIEGDDREILNIGQALYENDSAYVKSAWKSLTVVFGMAIAKQPVTTYSLLIEMENINRCLEAVQVSLDNAYRRLSWYMLLRRGWHWKGTYTPIDRLSLVEGALRRWHDKSVSTLGSI